MATITIKDINAQSFMTEVDANELNDICGGGLIRDLLHAIVDGICNSYGW